MNITFIYERFITGGIETLILRMSTWLLNNNHEVNIILAESGDLINKIDPRAKVNICGTRRYHSLRLPLYMPNEIKRIVKDSSILMSFGQTSLATALSLSSKSKNKPKVIAGVFSPWGYTSRTGIASYFKNSLPDCNKVFMSAPIKDNHAEFFGRSLDKAHAWPLPINSDMFIPRKTQPVPGKIVSIGRLTSFKTYNLYMIDIIKDLLDEGIAVEWHVYGDEDNSDTSIKQEMIARIRDKKLDNHIHLHGNIEYERIPEVLSDACCFIGMGTTLPEAASCGVPCIPAIADHQEATTYGYFYELPFGATGEIINNTPPQTKVIDLIRNTINMCKEQYIKEAQRHLHYASQYTMDSRMDELVNIFKTAESTYYSRFYYTRYLPSFIMNVGINKFRKLSSHTSIQNNP